MTPKQEKLIENYIRLKVKSMINEEIYTVDPKYKKFIGDLGLLVKDYARRGLDYSELIKICQNAPSFRYK